jgi:hypothetical protein
MKYFIVLASMMIIHFTLLHFDRKKESPEPPATENTKKMPAVRRHLIIFSDSFVFQVLSRGETSSALRIAKSYG